MSGFTGTGKLVGLIVRRDRVGLAIWVAVALLFPLVNAAALGGILEGEAQRQAFVAESAGSPLVAAFHGPILSASVEGLVAWRSLLQCIFATALGSLIFVVRHTRADEESGRGELLRAGSVGRHAGLTAALAVVFAADLLIAALLAGLLIGALGYPVAGSLTFALALGGSGWVFAAVAAVAGQWLERARAARAAAIAVLGGFWVVRMFAHSSGPDGALGWLVWLSPLGWAGSVQAYAGEQWWVLLLFVAAAAALLALAYRASARRDFGGGMWPARLGPAAARPGLGSPLALAWRLHRRSLLMTSVGLAAISAGIGWSSASFSALLAASPMMATWLAPLSDGTIGDAFLALALYVLVAILVAAHAIATALRARSEEAAGHLALLLSTAAGRRRWLASHQVFAVVGPLLLTSIVGSCAGLAYGVSSGRPGEIGHSLAAALYHLPVAWVMAGVAIALFGRTPRAAVAVTWGLMALFVFLVGLWEGGAIGRPWLDPLTYTHPMLAARPIVPAVLTSISAALMALGTAGFTRRDAL